MECSAISCSFKLQQLPNVAKHKEGQRGEVSVSFHCLYHTHTSRLRDTLCVSSLCVKSTIYVGFSFSWLFNRLAVHLQVCVLEEPCERCCGRPRSRGESERSSTTIYTRYCFVPTHTHKKCTLKVCVSVSATKWVSLFAAPVKVNLTNFDLVMESDLGTFAPVALQFAGSAAAQKVGPFFLSFLKDQCLFKF